MSALVGMILTALMTATIGFTPTEREFLIDMTTYWSESILSSR